MEKKLKRLLKKLTSKKTERALIVLLPCFTILVVAAILAPRLLFYMRQGRVPEMPAVESPASVSFSPAPTPSSSPSPSPVPSPSASPTATVTPVTAHISASSTERDLYVKLRDDAGNMLLGQEFTLSFAYPDGAEYRFKSATDGTCYLVDLEPGDYTVTMLDQDGFVAAAPVECTVRSQVEYVPIEDIDGMLDVVDNTQISQSEQKPAAAPVEELAPEVLSTPQDSGTVTELAPVLDTVGNQTYTYTFALGPNGRLLLSDNVTESDVIPVDENNDGAYEYGLQMVAGSTGAYNAIPLFNSDNTPVAAYAITAIPVTETVTATVGWQTIDGNTYYYDADGKKVTGLKSIDGLLYYFNQYGVRAKSLGIDVSFYNESINWPAVKAQGIEYAIIRVGGRGYETGRLYDDVCFQQNLSGARAAGLKVGVYFYTSAVDAVEAVQEASLVLDRLGGSPLDYPIYFDMEPADTSRRDGSLTKAQRTEIINAFCTTVQNAGYKAGFYSYLNFFKYSMDYYSVNMYSIWLASYTSFNQVPDFTGRYDMWQFTEAGVVNGINGVVDMNAIF